MSSAPGAFDRQWRKTTLGLVLVMSLVAFEAMAVATALPTTVRELDGLAYYGWPFTAFLITSIVGMVAAGGFADRRGARAPLLAGIAVFTAGLILAGVAQTMALFVLGRAVQGFGAGLIVVSVYVVLGVVYPDRARPRVFAALAAAWVLPALIGPVVAGAVTEALTWRLVFLGLPPFIAVGLLLLIPALRTLPAPRGEPTGTATRRILYAVSAGAGIALLQYAGQRFGLIGLACLLAGAGLLTVAVRRLLPAGTATVRAGLPAVIAFRGMLAGAFFAVDALLPLTLSTVHGYSPTAAGLPLMAGAVGWSAGSWVQGRAPDVARFVFVRAGFTMLSVACVTMVVIAVPAFPGWPAYPIWLAAGLGMGLAMPSVGVLLLELSAPDQRGENAAAMQISDVTLAALCIGAAGVLVAAADRGVLELPVAVSIVFVLMAALGFAGALLAGRVRPMVRVPLAGMQAVVPLTSD